MPIPEASTANSETVQVSSDSIEEILIITGVCFILSLIASGLLSQPISDALLSGLANTATEPVDISVSLLNALQIFGVAMLFASVAGIISVSNIAKYEPIKIFDGTKLSR
ncbi:MAG: FtsX-like permease family protein [Oscillospiraceae bacterium]|jgi:putative ABC transport system permease protein|nr:FtsX-like permease family protein [Oscillospiraceae bacterium]